ncbi:MAG: hypothetical protein LBK58_05640 [Prevotellaceae bacterium]|jgi:hypothetical protein|nr:hypothetical protein [Prevotellaceae bacterium]
MNRVTHALRHIALALVAVAGFGAIIMLLWNWLMPDVFRLECINIWQALGLLALARILFGGMGAGRFMGMGMMKHHGNPIREKWMQMTPEERLEFMKNRYYHHGFGYGFMHEDKSGKQE